MINLWKYKNALRLALDYIKNPYHLLEPTTYSKDAHEHICFARRLAGSNYKDVCPDYYTGKLEYVEHSDCCDKCPYMGIIDFCANEAGERSIKFYMDKDIVEVFDDAQNEEV